MSRYIALCLLFIVTFMKSVKPKDVVCRTKRVKSDCDDTQYIEISCNTSEYLNTKCDFFQIQENGPAQITRIPMNKYTLAKDNQKIYGSQCSMQLPGSAQHYRKESRFEIAMYLDIPDGKNCSDIPDKSLQEHILNPDNTSMKNIYKTAFFVVLSIAIAITGLFIAAIVLLIRERSLKPQRIERQSQNPTASVRSGVSNSYDQALASGSYEGYQFIDVRSPDQRTPSSGVYVAPYDLPLPKDVEPPSLYCKV
ncbi:hypothetical protein RRG08_024243 [Elysia crispata]|uniref:Uncharacterized protein n=1 Tax=Elysia crispata TaxID=231223 RepID=A0AAE0Z2A1_9GAST|nr:hypothetical protein RRG08_024243 [Elysia crispata]